MEGRRTIGEVARQSGVTAKAIRFYEAAGVLPPPARGANGYRLYTTEAVDLLKFIKQATGLGLSLAETKDILVIHQGGRPRTIHLKVPTIKCDGCVKGGGPFGFQPDIFDALPGTGDYRPLRAVHLVKWKNESAARERKAVAEVKAAEAGGEITVERPGIVVNMPTLTWPGGKR